MRRDSEEWRHREELVWLIPVAAASAILFLLGEIVGLAHGITATAVLGDYGWKALRALPFLVEMVLIAMLVRALLAGAASPLRAIGGSLRGRFGSPFLALAALSPLLLMPVMFSGYGVLKMLLPAYAPFAWDDAFAAADRALFLGRQPWTLTHGVLGSFEATRLIDRLYTGWVLLLSFAIVGFALFAPRYDRARFFLSFTAAWAVLGVIGAYLTSSAGPCYAELVGASSAGEFAPLMERLRGYSETQGLLGAVQWQEVLWDAHSGRRYGFGMGISAMPSLHNAIAVLYALALSRFGRGAAIGGWLFAAVTLVGSVHLGWHYAVDGIAAAAAMLVIWRLAGRYLERSGYAAAAAADRGTAAEPLPAPALA
jgi:PAP2 superfamily